MKVYSGEVLPQNGEMVRLGFKLGDRVCFTLQEVAENNYYKNYPAKSVTDDGKPIRHGYLRSLSISGNPSTMMVQCDTASSNNWCGCVLSFWRESNQRKVGVFKPVPQGQKEELKHGQDLPQSDSGRSGILPPPGPEGSPVQQGQEGVLDLVGWGLAHRNLIRMMLPYYFR